MQEKKIFFVSDVHLGHPSLETARWREHLFVQWLDEIKPHAEAIYLVGDIFDFWYEYRKVVPRGFVRTLGKLAELTDAGIPIHFFTGNHDVWVFDYLPKETGVVVHREPITQELKGKKFYIAHGDGLGPGDLNYKLLKRIFTSKTLQWLFSRLHPNFSLWLAHSWSNSSRDAKGIQAEGFNGEEKELIYLHAKKVLSKSYFDYMVFGHRHLMLDLPLGESRFINLGDWLYHFSYGVFDGRTFELKQVTAEQVEKVKNRFGLKNDK
ncbi:MAG TPA: UDP-2,3-diacylglucosamine hydrolase [Marinilabiliales bacterium]|nr:MAG: UDP-2,3-diacylglucosamine hydrolase [Bacteroidetes bacterium GWA2_40_14]OFX61713.1 MAG: UDP-2,3-diacylglucosamine hydrolase [Bacteroidetes bacterium GWC2_40_13]OFX72486.1 MAG: UDP-2,3-diacylglucosamine hydrolase [Bacteroidetes bacterium GWD2_40_43]OFX90570.1 MAG: UDP-2,3-diacylglucosamine hydrolase [Bacteroidetes bacterium GWE2_40_63]OFY17185.1 MAG: UDP-2,3-diacylglucosamine hydrolase [Bacteroidetes bacterium GWF2_40_13]OFZ26471.1 MAG: UDP-2,3-diacylglucosamine hydrolase [Bacteroidetes